MAASNRDLDLENLEGLKRAASDLLPARELVQKDNFLRGSEAEPFYNFLKTQKYFPDSLFGDLKELPIQEKIDYFRYLLETDRVVFLLSNLAALLQEKYPEVPLDTIISNIIFRAITPKLTEGLSIAEQAQQSKIMTQAFIDDELFKQKQQRAGDSINPDKAKADLLIIESLRLQIKSLIHRIKETAQYSTYEEEYKNLLHDLPSSANPDLFLKDSASRSFLEAAKKISIPAFYFTQEEKTLVLEDKLSLILSRLANDQAYEKLKQISLDLKAKYPDMPLDRIIHSIVLNVFLPILLRDEMILPKNAKIFTDIFLPQDILEQKKHTSSALRLNDKFIETFRGLVDIIKENIEKDLRLSQTDEATLSPRLNLR